MKKNNFDRFRRAREQRQVFGEEIHQKQLEIGLAELIALAQKHKVSLIEFLEDRSIPEKYKAVIKRKLSDHKGELNL